MSLNKSKKKSYIRPAIARNYLSFGDIVGGPKGWPMLKEELATVPPLAKLRPMEYNWYAESSEVQNGASEVICSGNVIVIGGTGGAGNRIGILKNDCEPGQNVTVLTEGDFDLQLQTEAIAGSPPLAAASTSGLAGKTAYYIAETGKFSDRDPSPAENATGFKVGVFLEDEATLFRPSRKAGIHFIRVRLAGESMLSNTAISAVADSATSFTESVYVNVPAPTVHNGGTVVRLEVDAATNNPNSSIEPKDVSWVVEGTAAGTGFVISPTFTTGTAKTVAVTVKGVTKNYTVTIAADTAPAAWTEV